MVPHFMARLSSIKNISTLQPSKIDRITLSKHHQRMQRDQFTHTEHVPGIGITFFSKSNSKWMWSFISYVLGLNIFLFRSTFLWIQNNSSQTVNCMNLTASVDRVLSFLLQVAHEVPKRDSAQFDSWVANMKKKQNKITAKLWCSFPFHSSGFLWENGKHSSYG